MSSSQQHRYHTHKFYIVLAGCYFAGKTSMVQRLLGSSSAEPQATEFVDRFDCRLVIGDEAVQLRLYDLSGFFGERHKFGAYFRKASAVCFTYDTASVHSFKEVAEWLRLFGGRSGSAASLRCLVGTKCDLQSERQVPRSAAESFAEQHGMEFFETSATTGDSVEVMFRTVAETLLARARSQELRRPAPVRLAQRMQKYRCSLGS